MRLRDLFGRSLARQDPRRDQLERLAHAPASGDQSALASIAALVVALRNELPPRSLEKELWNLVGAAINVVCHDDVLTLSEEQHLKALCHTMGLRLRDLRTQNHPAWEELAVARVNDGRPPRLENPPFLARNGERAYASFQVALLKEVVRREFRGRSSGVSIPLGLGVRYRTGSSRGKSVVVGTDVVVADHGVFVVTDQRALFIGDQNTLEFRRDKLVGMQQFADGLRLNVSNRQAPSLFRFARGESPTLAAALVVAG